MDTIFMNTKKESNVFKSQFPLKVDLRNPSKHVSLSFTSHKKHKDGTKNGTKNSSCVTAFIHYTIFIITFNTSTKSMNKEKTLFHMYKSI